MNSTNILEKSSLNFPRRQRATSKFLSLRSLLNSYLLKLGKKAHLCLSSSHTHRCLIKYFLRGCRVNWDIDTCWSHFPAVDRIAHRGFFARLALTACEEKQR